MSLVFSWVAVAVLVAFSVTMILVRQFCRPDSLLHFLDHPNDRSLHTQPTPRSGGVAIVMGIIVAIPFWLLTISPIPRFIIWLAVAALLIGVLAFLDDRSGISIGTRLASHLIAAALVVLGTGAVFVVSVPGIDYTLPAWIGLPISILFLVWMTNLYNFMDGMDGFAGGMSVFGFFTLALFGRLADSNIFMTFNLIIAAASAGFLVFNFPPARIFMGDTGSITLGFMAGAMLLWAEHTSILPLWLGIVIFSPFFMDATVTLLRRVLRRERIWQAHRSHYYQRLVKLGWGHRKTVLLEYLLMLLCSIMALTALDASTETQLFILIFVIFIYIVFFYGVNKLELSGLKLK